LSLYYNNFKYLDKNSIDQGLIVASFEPDDGFTDSFLSMEPIQEDYYDGTKVFDYGARYNTTAVINITVIKANGSDFSLADTRSLSRWLTGSRINSWLDVGPSKDDIKYSFLGRVTDLQPRKMDGRTTGFQIVFTSVSPWAFSAPQSFDCTIGQLIDIEDDGVVIKSGEDASAFGIDNGVLCVSNDVGNYFNITEDGVAYIDNMYRTTIDNKSDDLYTYIYLDIDYQNKNGTYVSIKNMTLQEDATIKNVNPSEEITISAKQFIISNIPNKLFGDDFNFVWPRLQPGQNDFVIDGDGNGSAKFTYRYPMKVGDCAMDISVYGGNNDCGEMASYETVKWENIIGAPTSIKGYGITDVYTVDEVDNKLQAIDDKLQDIDINVDIEWNDISNKPTTIGGYGITDAYTVNDVYSKTEVDDKLDDIEVSGGGTGSVSINEEELNNMLEDILG
jgi:hypothetical protein